MYRLRSSFFNKASYTSKRVSARSSATAITMSASARAAASTVLKPATPASPALPSSAPHDYSATCMLQGTQFTCVTGTKGQTLTQKTLVGWRDEDEQSGVVSEWGGSPDVRGAHSPFDSKLLDWPTLVPL